MKLNANEGSYKFHYPGPFIGKVIKKVILGLLNSTSYMCSVCVCIILSFIESNNVHKIRVQQRTWILAVDISKSLQRRKSMEQTCKGLIEIVRLNSVHLVRFIR